MATKFALFSLCAYRMPGFTRLAASPEISTMSVEVRFPSVVKVLAKLSPTVQLGAPAGLSVTTCAVFVLGKGELPVHAGCKPAAPSCAYAASNRRPVDDESRH